MNGSYDDMILNNRYKLLERIGLGGMAVVYKAVDLTANETVAIKILRDEYCSDEEFIKRFNNEAKAAASLSHPNIVKIYDVGSEGDVPYIVMEYVEGVTLEDYIAALQTLRWKDALKVAAQILAAVDHAHRHNIIHRDIKPMNIMVADNGVIKLTDFGIARAVSTATKSANNDSAGSVHYLSPEQARGGFVDERSDIYSIGITLYEMVTGVVPYDGDSHVSIALKHIDGKIVPPREVDPEIPFGVNDLIVIATKKDPAARFQSARDMLVRLEKVMENPYVSFINNMEEAGAGYSEAEAPVPQSPEKAAAPVRETEDESPDFYVNKAEIVRSVTLQAVAYVLAVVFGIVGILFVANIVGRVNDNMDRFVRVEYSLDDYEGLPVAQVISVLEDKGVRVVQEPVSESIYPKGYIISQSIEAGKNISSGETITFQVSASEGAFVLPDYTNRDYREVKQALLEMGVVPVEQPISSNQFAYQEVVRTVPSKGRVVEPGQQVTIYYSDGNLYSLVEVPDLVGLTLEQAANLLMSDTYKLNVGIVSPMPGEDITSLLSGRSPQPATPALPSATPEITPAPETAEPMDTPETDPEPDTPAEGTPRPSDQPEESPTDAPTPTEPAAPSASENDDRVYASDRVVYQYPKKGTMVYQNQQIDLYFYDPDQLRSSEERTMELPLDVDTGNTFLLRIEAELPEGDTRILFSSTVRRSDFPITYTVPLPLHDGYTAVHIAINNKEYMMLHVYGS